MATGTTQFLTVGTGSTDVDNFVPELWAGPAIVAREQNLVYARLVDRKFEEGLTFGDTIHVGSISNLAARQKTQEGTILFENINESNTDILIDQWFYSAIAMESFTRVQLNRNMLESYAGKLGYALGLQVDNTLADLPASLAAGTIVGTLADENTDDELILARQHLNDSDVSRTGRSWVFSPAAETGLLKLDRFIHSDYSNVAGSNSGETGLQEAYMGSFYRMPIYISTNVAGTNAAGHNNVLLQTEAFAMVMQLAPTTHHMFDIDFIVDKVVMEEIFGTKEMREDHAILVRGA